MVETVRMVKDEAELACLERAVSIGDETLCKLLDEIRPAMTEQMVAARIEATFRELGASGPSFESIVAGGARAALPHAHPTQAPLEEGDLVVLDFGCVVEGYCSDMTRTIAVGRPSPRHREIYDLVAVAQDAGREAIRPGSPAGQADAAARAVIEEAGYGPQFSHPLGHGVGLEIHEAPWVRASSTDILAPGHVITDEPGIYIPGFSGVRIEDMVVVTDDGCRTLTSSPRDLDALTV
jgi:Xaa-Pro aminopeptidase